MVHGAALEKRSMRKRSEGAAGWMKKEAPGAGEYLLKEAQVFRTFYPEVAFTVVKEDENEAELVFTRGCLGGRGKDPWALARSCVLAKNDVCRYCREAFRTWAGQLSLLAMIGPEGESNCRLRVRRPQTDKNIKV